MHRARFVFAAIGVAALAGAPAEPSVMWMLMSPNNRALGQSPLYQPTYGACREAVILLQARYAGLNPVCTVADRTGRWNWRLELESQTVAVSSRSYLRLRECTYNLGRFLAGLPSAELIDGARSLRGPRDGAETTPSRAGRVGLRPR